MLRRSLRILRTSLTILSLILFLATMAGWARSYTFTYESRIIPSHGPSLVFTAWYGCICLRSYDGVNPGFAIYTSRTSYGNQMSGKSFVIPPFDLPGWRILSFNSRTATSQMSAMEWELVVPLWFVALLFAIAPTLRLRAILRARKQTRARGFEVIAANQATTPD